MNCFFTQPLGCTHKKHAFKNPVQNYIFSAFRVIIVLFFHII